HFTRPVRRRPPPAIEQGHAVAARQRVADLERTGEPGAAKDEQVQRPGRARHRPRRGPGDRGQGDGGGAKRAELEQVAAGGAHGGSPRWSRAIASPHQVSAPCRKSCPGALETAWFTRFGRWIVLS